MRCFPGLAVIRGRSEQEQDQLRRQPSRRFLRIVTDGQGTWKSPEHRVQFESIVFRPVTGWCPRVLYCLSSLHCCGSLQAYLVVYFRDRNTRNISLFCNSKNQ